MATAKGSKSKSTKNTAQKTVEYKKVPRSDEFQADLQRRLNRAVGQLNGVKRMVDDNRYCSDILVQLAAVESAVRSMSLMIIQDHMQSCVADRIRKGDAEAIEETIAMVKRFTH